jgi:hypothetical protein
LNLRLPAYEAGELTGLLYSDVKVIPGAFPRRAGRRSAPALLRRETLWPRTDEQIANQLQM